MTRKLKVAGGIAADDREQLEKAIGSVLDGYSVGDVNRAEAIEELATLVAAVQNSNDPKRKPKRALDAA